MNDQILILLQIIFIDLVLAGVDAQNLTVETLGNIPIIARSGNIMSLDQLATIEIVSAAREIKRIGGRQAISIRIRPEESIALEDAVSVIEKEIIPKFREQASENGVSIFVRGAASELARTWTSMQLGSTTFNRADATYSVVGGKSQWVWSGGGSAMPSSGDVSVVFTQ